ncbi:MAG: HD domain-containing protein, partial [Clostridia bacterium]|nr:HD domain-containing protein [Clostridia bacterium]
MEENKFDLLKISKKLKKYLDEERLWHTLGVMHTAASLAMVYDVNVERAQVAGLLHDCAKCIPTKKKIKLCAENDIPVTKFEKDHPFLLHAKLGAWVARNKYNIKDTEILESIVWHTTGKEDMTDFEKIIYIADYIE